MIIFLHGADNFRSRQYLEQLIAKFKRDVDLSGQNILMINGETSVFEEIKSAVGAMAFLARKRLVIIKNIFSNKEEKIFDELKKHLEEKQENLQNILIFYDKLSGETKLSKSQKNFYQFLLTQKYNPKIFNPLVGMEITAWINQEVTSRGASIDSQAATLLANLVGANLWQAKNEIAKLVHYKNFKTIKHNDIMSMVIGQAEENIFALTDAIGSKNKILTLKLLEDQLASGANEIQLLSLIARQFKNLLRVKEASESGMTTNSIINLLKIHPFVIKKCVTQTRNFKFEDLKKILQRLLEIDSDIKTGKGNFKLLGELLIAEL